MLLHDESFFHYSVLTFFIISPLTFISCRYITAPYGKHHRKGWGPTLPPSLAWFFMESPTLWFSLILYPFGQHFSNPKSILLILTFFLHYTHRTIIYPLHLPTKPTNGYPITIAAIAFGYNIFNSYLQTRGVSHYADYATDYWFWWRFPCGFLVFIIGMFVNVKSDMMLVRLKQEGSGVGYKIPFGGLFEYVSCANYFGEIVEWLGWSLMTGSSVGFGFLLYTCANLIPRARANHIWYLEKFGEDYPKERKIVIPFLLSLKHREKCRTKPDQWQHFYYLRDSMLFWCQQLLLSMILSAFIRIGSEGENVGVRSVKLLQQKVGHQVEQTAKEVRTSYQQFIVISLIPYKETGLLHFCNQ